MMDRFAEITLLKPTYTKDDIGQNIKTMTEVPVFCKINNVSAAEFFRGGQDGLKPEYQFSMWGAEYEDETELKYNGKYYEVYRTYLNDDGRIELYCQRKVGNDV